MASDFAPDTESGPTRGRPRDFEPEVVLEAALDVFWRQGYRPTTTRELEQATGLSQSSIYNAFGSKRGLLDAALSHYEAATSLHLLEPLENSDEGLASILLFFSDLTDWVGESGRRGCMLINMMAEDGGVTPGVTARVRTYRDRVRAAFVGALGRAEVGGESTPSRPGVRADLLLALVMGLDIAARGGTSRSELNSLRDAIGAQINGWRRSPSAG